MTLEELNNIDQMMQASQVMPFDTPYGKFWIMEATQQDIDELQREIAQKFYIDDRLLQQLRQYELAFAWEFGDGTHLSNKPFKNTKLVVGNIALQTEPTERFTIKY